MDENEKVVYPPSEQPQGEPPPATEGEQGADQVNGDAAAVETSPSDGDINAVESTDGPPPEDPASDENAPVEEPPSRKGLLKKILIGIGILIVIIFLIALLVPKNQKTEEVKLVWWGLWEDTRAVQVAIDDFEKANPNITVEYIKQSPSQHRGRLEERIKNGTGPDIFRYHNSWTPMLSDVLTPLSTTVITPEEFEKNYAPVMQQDLTNNGAIYGIPVHADTLTMFINTDLFDQTGVQVPNTWEELVETARRLTVKDPDTRKIQTAGAALGTFNNVSHASDIVSMLFVQQGIDMTKITTDDNAKKIATALEFYTAFAKGEEQVWDATLDESVLAFARGNLGIFFGYSWDVFRIQRLNDKLNFRVYPVPGLQGGKNATIASYWVEGISTKSKHKKEAELFLKYLARKETAQKLYAEQSKIRAFGELYPRADLIETLKDNELVYPFVNQLPYARSTYFASDTYDGEGGLNSALNAYLGNAVTSIANGDQATDTAVKTLNKGISQVYKKYGIKSQ